MIVATFGTQCLSHNQPHPGAVMAYVPPLITNISPNTTGDSENGRKCGSRVACRKPIDMEVTMMEPAAIRTPGIRKALKIEAERNK